MLSSLGCGGVVGDINCAAIAKITWTNQPTDQEVRKSQLYDLLTLK